jgi:hypothetical protein
MMKDEKKKTSLFILLLYIHFIVPIDLTTTLEKSKVLIKFRHMYPLVSHGQQQMD